MIGIEPGSFVITASALNHCAISLAQEEFFWFILKFSTCLYRRIVQEAILLRLTYVFVSFGKCQFHKHSSTSTHSHRVNTGNTKNKILKRGPACISQSCSNGLRDKLVIVITILVSLGKGWLGLQEANATSRKRQPQEVQTEALMHEV